MKALLIKIKIYHTNFQISTNPYLHVKHET
jgi:hypothetical protein